jgi:hypothetical protein
MQPLYFLAGVTKATLEPGSRLCRSLLAARGLAEVFADVGEGDYAASELSGRGPGDRPGTILSYITPAGSAARRLGFYPDEQQWTQVGDDVWLGLDPADLPTPEDLRRKRQCDGYLVELADGRRYVVPVIRRPDGSSDLPRELVINPLTGRLEEPVKDRYRRYWDASAEVASWFFTEGFDNSSFTKQRGLALATEALSLNYRYGPLEQFVLRLVDAQNYLAVLGTTVDVAAVLAAGEQKKSGDAADLSTSHGPPAS